MSTISLQTNSLSSCFNFPNLLNKIDPRNISTSKKVTFVALGIIVASYVFLPFAAFCMVSITSLTILSVVSIKSYLHPHSDFLNKAKQLMNMKRIYWVMHPYLTPSTKAFPYDAMNIFDPMLYGFKTFFLIFKEKKFEVMKRTHNEFLLWLNNSSENTIDKFYSTNDIMFMNCVDFVYLSLYLSGKISKIKILEIYNNQRNKHDPNIYYGFDLKKFKELKHNQGKPGDIIIAFDKDNKPVHALILSENNRAISLWNGIIDFTIKEDSLENLKNRYSLAEKNKNSMTFKYCPLQEVIK